MRVYALFLLVAALSIYAYRDWFRSLCGLILLMAVLEHPDMPKGLLGVPGLNPWNILLLNVLAGWALHRRREGARWDMPRYVSTMLLIYLTVIVVGFLRALVDIENAMKGYTVGAMFNEELFNTIKWVIPGLLLYDGCRNRQRMALAIAAVLGIYVLLALQVIRWMPLSSALSSTELTARARKILLNEIGYHSVNMSMMLSGASWAVLAALPVVKARKYKLAMVLVALVVVYAQALTGGRMGYVTWGVVGVILCLLKWRRYLALFPVVLAMVIVFAPGAVDRMLTGFGTTDVSGQTYTSDYEVTSGRTMIWPYVIDKIWESPVVGYGRLAMTRTGLARFLKTELSESFPHPHNAYLEWLLDNGVLGFVLVAPFYVTVVFLSLRLFRDSQDPWSSTVGGMALALVLALLVASAGSQTFYPREGAVGMWCAIGLMLRVSQDKRRSTHVPQPRRARP